MKNIKFSAFALLGAAFVMIFFFQNCAPPTGSGNSGSSSQSSLSVDGYYEWPSAKAQSAMGVYESICSAGQTAAAGYSAVASGANMNAFGTVNGRITQVASLIGSATVTLYADQAGAPVSSVSNFDGKITLCGIVNLGAINGRVKGDILVEGTVGPIDGFEGTLIIIGGDFPISVRNMKGIILVKNAQGEYIGRTY